MKISSFFILFSTSHFPPPPLSLSLPTSLPLFLPSPFSLLSHSPSSSLLSPFPYRHSLPSLWKWSPCSGPNSPGRAVFLGPQWLWSTRSRSKYHNRPGDDSPQAGWRFLRSENNKRRLWWTSHSYSGRNRRGIFTDYLSPATMSIHLMCFKIT